MAILSIIFYWKFYHRARIKWCFVKISGVLVMYRLNIVVIVITIAIVTTSCTAIVELAGDGDHYYNKALKEVNTGPTGGVGAITLARHTKKYENDSKFKKKVDKLYAYIDKKHMEHITQKSKRDCIKELSSRDHAVRIRSSIERRCGMKMEPEPLMSVTEIDAYAQVCRRAASYDQNISDAYANANYKKCMKNVSRNYYRIKEWI